MFTFSSPSHLCDLSLTPVISLRLYPLHLIRKIKGKRVFVKWRRAWWETSPSQGPACSISHFSLPSLPLCEPRELLVIIPIVLQTKQTKLAQAGETSRLSHWKVVKWTPPTAAVKWLPGVGWWCGAECGGAFRCRGHLKKVAFLLNSCIIFQHIPHAHRVSKGVSVGNKMIF